MFDPLNPDPDLINLGDIFHALSLLCRANGHFRNFYSVAQHSVNCMEEAKIRGYSRRVQLACLLHDASEAYLSDVTRPVKQEIPKYLEIEKPLQEAIWKKYLGDLLTEEEYEQVLRLTTRSCTMSLLR
jgi:5'-deoxynucleotidase YfbR-like HD superfamily hydrolase